jgi:cytoskeleton protein RodZ
MPDASPDFGAHLRQAREQRGVSLRDIATRTKISVLALEALERNDVSRLPGGIFTRAFVRAYANEVGLDAEEAVRRFLARFPDQALEEMPRQYEPNPEHISVDEPPTVGRAWRAVAWSLPLVLVVAYFGFGGRLPWWGDRSPLGSKTAESAARQAPEAPPVSAPSSANGTKEPVAAEPGALPSAGHAPGTAGAGGATPAATAAESAVVPAASSQPPAPAPATPPSPAPAAPPAQPDQGAADQAVPPGAFRVTLAARDTSWVSVRVDGTSVLSGTMRPGERKDLVLRGTVSLTVGNAAAFGLFINGAPARSLGGPGQVATIRLTVDNLRTFLEGQ